MFIMFYNQNLGFETKIKEYKQLVLHTLLSKKKSIQIIIKNKLLSNRIIFKELSKSIEKYVLKYMCSFLNVNLKGTLYFGVNDNGQVIGFPWKGKLIYHKRLVHQLLKNQIKKLLFSDKIESNIDKNYIFNECLKFSIIMLDKKKSKNILKKELDVAMELYTIWLNEKKIYDSAYLQYYKINTKYSKCINIFTQKLKLLLTDKLTQKYLLIYIAKRTSIKEYNILKKKIKYKDYPILKSGEILEYKKNKKSPYYWVTKFKDFYVDNYSKYFKPRKPQLIFRSLNPSMIVSLLQPMYYRWIMHKDINLYIILIEFNNPLNKKIELSYRKSNGKTSSPKREITKNGEPFCNPYDSSSY